MLNFVPNSANVRCQLKMSLYTSKFKNLAKQSWRDPRQLLRAVFEGKLNTIYLLFHIQVDAICTSLCNIAQFLQLNFKTNLTITAQINNFEFILQYFYNVFPNETEKGCA